MSLEQMKTEAFGSAGSCPVWYHGAVSRGDAERKLTGAPQGTYMIRDSSSSAGSYVMSVSEAGKVSHYIIQRVAAGVYHIGDRDFKDLVAVLEFYKKHLLDSTTITVPLLSDEKLQHGKLATQFLFSVVALYSFNAKDPEDLGFRKGEVLNVLEQHEPQWWRAQSQKTLNIGCIPVNYVKKIEEEAPPPPVPRGGPSKGLQRSESVMDPPKVQARREPPPPPPIDEDEEPAPPPPRPAAKPPAPAPAAVAAPAPLAKPAPKPPRAVTPPPPEAVRPKFLVARATLDRVANAYDHTALSFKAGDTIHVKKQNENGLWEGCIVGGDGKEGHFPFTLVELLDCSEYDDDIAALEKEFNAEMDEIYGTG